MWTLDRVRTERRERARYEPKMDAGERERLLGGWHDALARVTDRR
jgi:glycerol kinase